MSTLSTTEHHPKRQSDEWTSSLVPEIKGILRTISSKAAAPLFLIFWLADLIYVPHLKWEFLLIRASMIPVCLVVLRLTESLTTYDSLSRLMVVYSLAAASGINVMIFMIGDPSTPYYAGLALVALGSLSFMPFTKKQFYFVASGIFGPFLLFSLINYWKNGFNDLNLVNLFFVFASVSICFLIRFFQADLRRKEYEIRQTLKKELQDREEIIRKKTDEAVKLTQLSSQFSPQIVESIRNGKIDLDSTGKRAEICTIFVDIVNSTERVTRIDKDKVEKVLSKFLDDSIKIMLKYDITIDKFLGDGILGFCNAPLRRSDYTTRVIHAALELRQKIASDADFYEKYWLKELEIRIGIAKGFANVGFYGSQKYYKSYTAIGPVVNLASRLCSVAQPGQIVVDHDVYEIINTAFETEHVGKKVLKGFDDDVIHVYQVIGQSNRIFNALPTSECETCGGLLSLETDPKGHFVFICRSCCSISQASLTKTDSAA